MIERRSSAHPSVVEVRELDVRYPEAHALRGVDLSIESGSFVLVGGPSGSGKSTLARALMGLLTDANSSTPAEVTGRVSVAGLTPRRDSVAELATRVGLVFQNPSTQLFNGTVEDEVAFGPRNLGLAEDEIADRVAYALEASRCAHLRDRAVRHLSGGEQQRVAIAASLAMSPSVLILDEPTANLDAEGTRSVVQALHRLHRKHGVTVVVIEHRLEPFLACAERLIWLDEGRVAADGPPDVTFARADLGWAVSPPSPAASGDPLVCLQDVSAGYDGQLVLRGCSLTLHQGDFAALVGPNGAGKSTLARVLAGVLRPRRGRVVWHGNGRRVSPSVGLLQQNPLHQLVCDTVEQEVRFGPRNLGAEGQGGVEVVLGQADLRGLRHRPTQTLSVGEQQRAALAATLVLRPRLLILDEPTIGQDRQHLRQVMDFASDLNGQGQTVLLITHDRRLVERYANRVWRMVDGQVQGAGSKRQGNRRSIASC